MKTVEVVRRERLKMLVEKAGSQAALNQAIGKSRKDASLGHILNENEGTKTGKPKTMGSVMARMLEEKLKKEPGWMDTDPDLWPFKRVEHRRITALPPDLFLVLDAYLDAKLSELEVEAKIEQLPKKNLG